MQVSEAVRVARESVSSYREYVDWFFDIFENSGSEIKFYLGHLGFSASVNTASFDDLLAEN